MNKWQEKTIANLMRRGYDSYTASKIYERAYKRVGSLVSKDYNREFETFMSISSDKNFIQFDIKGNKLFIKDTGEDAKPETFAKAMTLNRVSNLAAKYLEVNDIVEDYIRGNISLNELNQKIKEFKKSNAEYQKEGS